MSDKPLDGTIMDALSVVDLGFDASNPAKILPLVESAGDRKLLAEWIDEREEYRSVDPETPVDEADFDLCVLDPGGFERYGEALRARKREAEPSFHPVLLLVPEPGFELIEEDRGELVDGVLQSTVDEFVSLPIKQVELAWRLRALLRLRSQTLEMQAREAELRRFKRANEAAGHAVYITDAEGIIEYVNPAFESITGYSPADAIGENPRILRSGEMSEGYYEALWETVSTGEIWEEEVINRRQDGEVYFAHQTIAPILDDDGSADAYVAIQTDITERKEAAREFETLIDNLPGIVYRCENDPAWPMSMVHGDSETLTGYPAERIESGDVSYGEDIIHPEDREAVWTEVQAAIVRGEPYTLTYRILTEDGEEKWVWEKGRIVHSVDDDVARLEGFITDITDRKELETRLRHNKERYESLFNSIRDAILVADTDRRIVDCNPAFEELFGYDLAEIEGEPASSLYASQAEFEALGDAIEDHMEDPDFVVTVDYQKRSGQVFPGETNVFYLRDADGENTGFIALIRDVSGRRDRIEQLQVIDRVLRHNLHNDMTVIEGNAEKIRDGAPPEYAADAERIIASGRKLLNTVDKERAITKFLSDPPRTQHIDLVDAIRTVADTVGEAHPDATLDFDLPETCLVAASPAIEDAIGELFENAVNHSDRDNPTVAAWIDEKADTATLHVADDGPGIPDMEQDVLTGDADIGPLYHGSGLGLWLVNLVVRQSDGVLEFEENDPRGSVVSICLPRA